MKRTFTYHGISVGVYAEGTEKQALNAQDPPLALERGQNRKLICSVAVGNPGKNFWVDRTPLARIIHGVEGG